MCHRLVGWPGGRSRGAIVVAAARAAIVGDDALNRVVDVRERSAEYGSGLI